MSSRYTIPGEIIYHSCKRVSGAAIRGLFAPSRPIVCFQFIKNSKKVRITIATAVRIGVNRPNEIYPDLGMRANKPITLRTGALSQNDKGRRRRERGKNRNPTRETSPADIS